MQNKTDNFKMNEPKPIDVEAVPEDRALAIRQQPGAVGILRPADTLDAIADAFKQYQAVCERILTKDDYQEYEGKPRKKKSAWRKLATAFNVSTEIMAKEVLRGADGRSVVMAEVRVRASTNGGRQSEALGSCDVNEKCCAIARGQKCHKAAWKGHYCCQNGCDGRRHWSHPDHDIISTAQTRATNRAIADLIGCGEVSAEEIIDSPPPNPAGAKRGYQGTSPPPKTPPAPASAQIQPSKSAGPHLKPPTEATRQWMILELTKAGLHDIGLEYFRKIENPSILLPNEGLADVPLKFIPYTRSELSMLITRIEQFARGDRAEPAFPPHHDAEDKHPAKPAAASLPKPGAPNPLWWRDVIIPIPRKNQKLSEYVGHEDTIGSLYDLRHGSDDEAQAARQRLWGMVEYRSDPDNLTDKDGKKRKATDVDITFAKALQAFKKYFEETHRGERL